MLVGSIPSRLIDAIAAMSATHPGKPNRIAGVGSTPKLKSLIDRVNSALSYLGEIRHVAVTAINSGVGASRRRRAFAPSAATRSIAETKSFVHA